MSAQGQTGFSMGAHKPSRVCVRELRSIYNSKLDISARYLLRSVCCLPASSAYIRSYSWYRIVDCEINPISTPATLGIQTYLLLSVY